jgi:glycogen debranching enzyme
MSQDVVKILDGNTFVVSDSRGDIDSSPTDPNGFFTFDTRFLSKWILTVDGRRLMALSTDDLQYFETRFFLVPGTGTVYVDAQMSVIRSRSVGNGFHETLQVLNHAEKGVDVVVRIEADADFADLFEVKDAQEKKGKYHTQLEHGRLVFGYERETYRRQTSISTSQPAKMDEHGLTFTVHIGPQGSWETELHVVPGMALGGAGKAFTLPHLDAGGSEKARGSDVWRVHTHHDTEHHGEAAQAEAERGEARRDMQRSLEKWMAKAPRLICERDELRTTYKRSLIDMAALRFSPLTAGGRALPAAGLPWFMALFGRDSILTSLQALPFEPELAATTLRELAARQGTRRDDFRDEDPGRILHEMRYGELTAFEERPHSPYFGNADATPLFVVLLDEYEKWTGDDKLVKALEFEARAALNWIDEYADLTGSGYISYQRRLPTGLENQCWKDSWDSISYHDGRLPGFPRATCELQGYAYDAKTRAARLARLVWKDEEYADKLESDAAALKERFNRDFWVADGEYYALALDADGTQVDSLSSNIGHLLWSGIVDDKRAKTIVGHLMSSRLYSGWGVRTLAEGEARYNPIGYHVGTVWPFDNSFIAWGLRRYGFKKEAAKVAAGILAAAEFFQGRLPEAFGGYSRDHTKYPVQYPTACSPQAWSTGTPLLLLRTLLGLEPVGEHLVVDPALPEGMGHLELLDIPGRWGKVDAMGRG